MTQIDADTDQRYGLGTTPDMARFGQPNGRLLPWHRRAKQRVAWLVKTKLQAARWTVDALRDRAKNRGRERLTFTCNLCGHRTSWTREAMTRESRSCRRCGSTVRFRNVMDAISVALWGQSRVATELEPLPLRGLGFSDPGIYARHLQRLTDYQNSFFHQEPRRDLMDHTSFGGETFDYVVCSEVLEHVDQPVETAFETLFEILNPGGVLIVSVPLMEGETQEHFPRMAEWRLSESDEGWSLVGSTVEGQPIERKDLVFHGGPGATLEMRMFGRADFERELKSAGFTDVQELWGHREEFGIVSRGTPAFVEVPGGTVHGMHAGVWIARRA